MKNLSLKTMSIHVPLSQTVLWPVGAVILVILSLFFYVLPTMKQISVDKASIMVETGELKKLENKYTTLANSDEGTLNNDLVNTRAAVPEFKNVPGVIAGLSRLAAENKVSIDTLQLKPGRISTESAAQEVTVRLAIRGNIRSLNDFLTNLRQIRRVFSVQRLNGSSNNQGDELLTQLDLNFYTLPLPEQLPDFSAPLPDITPTKQELIKNISKYQIYTDAVGNTIIASASASPSATPRPASPSAGTR